MIIDYFDKDYVLSNLQTNIDKSNILKCAMSKIFKYFKKCNLYINSNDLSIYGLRPYIFIYYESEDIEFKLNSNYIHTSSVKEIRITKDFKELFLITENSIYAFNCNTILTKKFIEKYEDNLLKIIDIIYL